MINPFGSRNDAHSYDRFWGETIDPIHKASAPDVVFCS